MFASTAWINCRFNEKMIEHPAYDAFWQGQALDKLVAEHPSQVPTMWIQGLWDQEDMWGRHPLLHGAEGPRAGRS